MKVHSEAAHVDEACCRKEIRFVTEPWQDALEEQVEGEIRFDPTSKVLYSTDASMYQIEPIGVVYPRHADDVARTIRIAYEHGVPVTPRGPRSRWDWDRIRSNPTGHPDHATSKRRHWASWES